MERYFLGNNTAYGFMGNYESELQDKKKVILLKGGPGTGKSTILKNVAKEAVTRGYDYELWFCSGDPKSLDGVYIKGLNIAVVDATSPHATGADLPVVKDVIIDLATSLDESKLARHTGEIKTLVNCKKHRFIRTYQHLNIALCHYRNQIALEKRDEKEGEIRAEAVTLARELYDEFGQDFNGKMKGRKLFVSAICPAGINAYFDHLNGKKIYKIIGSEWAAQVFIDEVKGLLNGVTYLLNPLEPKNLDGIVGNSFAVVRDVGGHDDYNKIDLREFDNGEYSDEIEEERNGVILEKAFAIEELNRAREYHLELEKYFVAAMDFNNNNRLFDEIVKVCFG